MVGCISREQHLKPLSRQKRMTALPSLVRAQLNSRANNSHRLPTWTRAIEFSGTQQTTRPNLATCRCRLTVFGGGSWEATGSRDCRHSRSGCANSFPDLLHLKHSSSNARARRDRYKWTDIWNGRNLRDIRHLVETLDLVLDLELHARLYVLVVGASCPASTANLPIGAE